MSKKRARGRPVKPARNRLSAELKVSVTPEVARQVRLAAWADGRDVSAWLRELIRAWSIGNERD